MAEADDLALIIRAACGDAEALAALAQRDEEQRGTRMAALLALDPDPSPLALGAALALTGEPPEPLRERARASATLQALGEPDAAPLLAALCAREATFRRAAAAFESLDPTRAAPIFLILDMLDPPPEKPQARLSADAASPVLRAAIPLLLAVAARSPWSAPRAGGALWNVIDDDRRAIIARSAARGPGAAADLMARIGPDGWRLAPDDARQALLDAVARNPWSAARGGGAVWPALDDESRAIIARSAAQSAEAAADLMEWIGLDGWRLAPEDARQALLDAAARNIWRAARGGTVWTALDGEQRATFARRAARNAFTAADLMEWIGLDGWRIAPDDARRALFDAVARNPWSAARGGGAVWAALDDKQQNMLARSAAQDAFAAADLLERIGAEGWRITPKDARQALIDALENSPRIAARGGAAVWTALDAAEQRVIIAVASRDARSAADLLARIGADGFDLLAPDARSAALKAAFRSPGRARRVAEALRQRLDAAERAAAMRSIARKPQELAAWLTTAGAQAWESLAPPQRAAALERTARDPDAAARLGAALWDALDNDQRKTLARSAARDPDAAARLTANVGARLDDDLRGALARAALGGADASRIMAQALADGAPWRFWMALFLPAADDAADVWDAWRAVIHRLPPTVAARLAPRRGRR